MQLEARAWLAASLAGLAWGTSLPHAIAAFPIVFGAWACTWAITGSASDWLRGAWFGALWYGGCLTWFPGSWSTFSGDGGLFVYAGFVVLELLVPTFVFGLAGALHRRSFSPGLALGAAWVVAESISEWVQPLPAGPAVLLAEAPLLLVWASFAGKPLLSGLLHASFGLGRRGGVAIWCLWLASGALWLATEPQGPKVTVGLVQPNFGAFEMRRYSTAQDRLQRLVGLLRELREVDFIVTPEGAWPLDPGDGPGARQRHLLAQLQPLDLPPVVLGTHAVASAGAYNRLLVVDGLSTQPYDKRFLVPLAEETRYGLGSTRYVRGTLPRTLQVAGIRMGPLICYEDLLDSALDQVLLHDPELLLAATNDTWSGPGRAAHQHLAAARLAAVTTGRYVLRPAISGISAVLDTRGRLVWHAPFVDADTTPRPGLTAQVSVPRLSPAWAGHTLGRLISIALALGLAGVLRR